MASFARSLSLPGLFVLALVCTALLCASALPAGADAPTTRPATSAPADSIKRWFDQLSDVDPGVREQASDHLLNLQRDDLAALRGIVQQQLPLTPTQMEALPEIVREVYLSGEAYNGERDQGFLGIQTHEVDIASTKVAEDGRAYKGILVLGRVPGFCGARALRNGDVIVGITDLPDFGFIDVDSFRNSVRKHLPGSNVRFQVLRRGQICEVSVKLDPRPVSPDLELNIIQLEERREQAFHAYWETTFAPLLKEEVSVAANQLKCSESTAGHFSELAHPHTIALRRL